MKSIARSILSLFIIFLAMLAVFGAFFGLIRCLIIAAVIGAIGAVVYRVFIQRPLPTSQQIIDQSPLPASPIDANTQVAKQIEARKEHLDL